MTIQFSVARQLALALAWVPALAFGGPITYAAPVDPTPVNISPRYPTELSDDRFLQKQKLTSGSGKDALTLAAGSAAAASTAATAATGLIPGRGVVLTIDRANATVKMNHDPIPALNWPRMTMSFRLKESALADQVKKGDAVEFFLEKSGSDYVIVKWRK
ncbi:copper-binding protein [Nitrosospira sp. Is2]|uniref:copper-binding protein n=1 Tax=Nitrosospira sp. Is2 TaxID=3080532 RepID=UPI0029545D23|nr:copper-binding protein [Nitrosospira sp. Is2]WON73685.1 copper-binding protein [Nitrosospira sp. Is2]